MEYNVMIPPPFLFSWDHDIVHGFGDNVTTPAPFCCLSAPGVGLGEGAAVGDAVGDPVGNAVGGVVGDAVGASCHARAEPLSIASRSRDAPQLTGELCSWTHFQPGSWY